MEDKKSVRTSHDQLEDRVGWFVVCLMAAAIMGGFKTVPGADSMPGVIQLLALVGACGSALSIFWVIFKRSRRSR
jgi:hypothetical protein